jgi:phosphoadenosine phosphosulfate reductase
LIGAAEQMHFHSERFRARLVSALAITDLALATARRPYVAVSGGKDSLVVMALALRVKPEIDLLWSDDELEYPETVAFMDILRSLAGDQLRVTLGYARHAGWFRPWRRKPAWRAPFPDAIRVGCDVDDWMGRRAYDLTLLGTRASESRKRRDWLVSAGHTYTVSSGTGKRCCPIWDWTEDDVWGLIAGWGLPYNTAYDRLDAIGISRERQRVGPLPLSPRTTLDAGWPDLLARLETRYGKRWE